MEVKQIMLIFENCESMTIPRKYIGVLFIDDIKTSISRCAINSISKSSSCESFGILIKSEYSELGRDRLINLFTDAKPFERALQYSDITSIEVVYEDDSKEVIYVNWCDSDELWAFNNEYQSSGLNSIGDLWIEIGKDDVDESVYEFTEWDWDMVAE